MTAAVVDGDPPSHRNTSSPLLADVTIPARKLKVSIPTLPFFLLRKTMVPETT